MRYEFLSKLIFVKVSSFDKVFQIWNLDSSDSEQAQQFQKFGILLTYRFKPFLKQITNQRNWSCLPLYSAKNPICP